MNSPGHQRAPQHKVEERPVPGRMKVMVGDMEIGSAEGVIAVLEDGCPVRYYFPRAVVSATYLQPSASSSICPFKGTASYFSLVLGQKKLTDAVWCYEDPYDEHLALKGRLAFYDDKWPEIRVTAG